ARRALGAQREARYAGFTRLCQQGRLGDDLALMAPQRRDVHSGAVAAQLYRDEERVVGSVDGRRLDGLVIAVECARSCQAEHFRLLPLERDPRREHDQPGQQGHRAQNTRTLPPSLFFWSPRASRESVHHDGAVLSLPSTPRRKPCEVVPGIMAYRPEAAHPSCCLTLPRLSTILVMMHVLTVFA